MGGRGANSSSRGSAGGGGGGIAFATAGGSGGAAPQQQQSVANQAPSPANTPVVPNAATALSQMTDDQLATLYRQSRNVDMPNHLNDVADRNQKFVYMAGVNAKPQVLDQASFDQYLKDNNISRREILSRTTGGASYTVNGTQINLSANQVADMTRYSDLNYIGGKHGGQVYGAGTYFAQNGGGNTGYGGYSSKGTVTMLAVVNPQTAKPISLSSLRSQTAKWSKSHPKFSGAVGSFSSRNASIYALAQGYNIITDGSGYNTYHNVIDRSAIVIRANNL